MAVTGKKKSVDRGQPKKKQNPGKKDAEEKELETLLFGNMDGSESSDNASEHGDAEGGSDGSGEALDNEEETFFFDSGLGFVMDSMPDATKDMSEDHAEAMDRDDSGSDEEQEDEDEDEDDDEDKEETPLTYGYKRKAAWQDEDDARIQVSLLSANRLKHLRKSEDEDVVSGVEYEQRLRRQFAKVYPRPDWAKLPSEKALERRERRGSMADSDDSDYESGEEEQALENEKRLDLLKSTYGILEKRRSNVVLDPSRLDIVRMKNANQMAPCKATVSTLAFHPNAQVLATGSRDKTLRLFQIDGKVNPKIQSIYFKDMPILASAFHPSGDQMVLTGRRPHFYIYDIQSGTVDRSPGIWGRKEMSLENMTMSPCGRYMTFLGRSGHITLVSYLTKQWIGDLKMNGLVTSVSWSADSRYLYGIGTEAEIYQWDVGERQCVQRWADDGGIRPSVIRLSPDDSYCATGSSSGVVNIYKTPSPSTDASRLKPFKAVDNLRTDISDIKFNHDSQIMAIASDRVKDQLKLVHLPTGRIFTSWPTQRTPLGYVSAMDFSPNSDYIAIGNARGTVLLYSLKQYVL